MFRCAVLRNPVTDIASMVALTDIPDWCFVETVGREAYADLPSLSTLQTMREAGGGAGWLRGRGLGVRS
jgi:acylaminoacyl-peptidase